MTTHAAPVSLDSRLTDFLTRNERPAGRHAKPRTVGDVWPVIIHLGDGLDHVSAKLHEIGRKQNQNALNAERHALRALIFN